jgi:polyhydroxyalkanoate synthase
LFAAQADFTEAGELSLFITESQLALIEDMMWKEGYLDQRQMAGAFKLLRSQDLIWSRTVREYMLGERRPMTDLGAWNADATRMPYRMHSEYLRKLFLNNDLAEGRLEAGGKLVFPQDISVPVFAVSTERDHIAPWHSVYKLVYMLDCDTTFVLASGGHNTGIVAPPDSKLARYRILEHRAGQKHPPAEQWAASVKTTKGSWWEVWTKWLEERSGVMVKPPAIGGPTGTDHALEPAPGSYVRET